MKIVVYLIWVYRFFREIIYIFFWIGLGRKEVVIGDLKFVLIILKFLENFDIVLYSGILISFVGGFGI